MKFFIKGRTIFTDDGFTPESYDNKRMKHVIKKILGDYYYDYKVQIIGGRKSPLVCGDNFNLLSYSSEHDNLSDIEIFTERFKDKVYLPHVDGLIVNKKSNIAIIAYGKNVSFFTIYSETSEDVIVFVLNTQYFCANCNYIQKIASDILGDNYTIRIDGASKENQEYFKSYFFVNSEEYNVEKEYGIDLDSFECYKDSKMHVFVCY